MKKLFLEIYGLLRMVYGVALAVGLSASYFVTEFVLSYPKNSKSLILEQDEISLIYMAVLLRAVFHIGAGIGIARIKLWGRAWLTIGWPVLLLITLGVALSVHTSWYEDGYVKNFGQTIVWESAGIYLIFAALEMFGLGYLIKDISKDERTLNQYGGRLPVGRVGFVLGIAVIAFVILIFTGRPIKDAFYAGFYKQDGRKISAARGTKTSILKVKPQKKKVIEDLPKVSGQDSVDPVVNNIQMINVDQIAKNLKQTLPVQKISVAKGFSYAGSLGYFAAVMVIAGFLFELLNRYQNGTSSLMAYCLLIFGFILWVAYGVMATLPAVTLMGFGVAVICILMLVVVFEK